MDSFLGIFADDTLIAREIRCKEDQVMLHHDLDILFDWNQTWGMIFNPSKCKHLSVTNNTVNKFKFTYKIDGTKLTEVKRIKYLGCIITNKFSWTPIGRLKLHKPMENNMS